mmetsp:Transcript_19429/g.41857  ORF Transcript_19429/g.41857 Transcript_19429/m.41857 type:complete len:433 (-) Transcript_19429:313-1611(-)
MGNLMFAWSAAVMKHVGINVCNDNLGEASNLQPGRYNQCAAPCPAVDCRGNTASSLSHYHLSQRFTATSISESAMNATTVLGQPQKQLVQPSIPRIIHQMSHMPSLPATRRVVEGCTRWMDKLHQPAAGWCIKRWSDPELRLLVHTTMPRAIRNMYEALPFGVMRADLARYLVVMLFGGWYADTDIVCRGSLDQLLPGKDLVLIAQPSLPEVDSTHQNQNVVANFLFGSTSQHPFWHVVLEEMLVLSRKSWSLRINSRFDIIAATGPGMLSRALRRSFNVTNTTGLHVLAPTKLVHSNASRGVSDTELEYAVFRNGSGLNVSWKASKWGMRIRHKRQAAVLRAGSCVHCYHYNYFTWASGMHRKKMQDLKKMDRTTSRAYETHSATALKNLMMEYKQKFPILRMKKFLRENRTRANQKRYHSYANSRKRWKK